MAEYKHEHGGILLLPSRPTWKEKFAKELSWERLLTLIAVLAAVGQGFYARQQSNITQHSLELTRDQLNLSQSQFEESKRQGQEQAKNSAELAHRQAEVTAQQIELARQLSSAAKQSASVASRELTVFEKSVHSGMQPLLTVTDVSHDTQNLVLKVANKGRMSAEIKNLWCGAAIFSNRDGNSELAIAFQTTDGSLLFPAERISPDGHEELKLLAIAHPADKVVEMFPQFRVASYPLSWVEVCDIPYSDELDKRSSVDPHHLRLCYDVQFMANSDQGYPVLCPPKRANLMYSLVRQSAERGTWVHVPSF